jgi:hypothetical protein
VRCTTLKGGDMDISLIEKYYLLEDNLGEYDAIESILLELPNPGTCIEKLIQEFFPNEIVKEDNLLAYFLEVYSGQDAVEFWRDNGDEVDTVLDKIISDMNLDEYESSDGFDSYNDFCSWRNE